MTDLYRRHGSAPAPLPSVAYDDAGNAYTAPYEDDDLARLGFVVAPPRPDDTEAQTVEWDATAEAWIMVDRPPPPPAPEPDPFASFIPVPVMRQRIEKLGLLEEFASYLALNPVLMMKLFTLESTGIDPTYPAIIEAFDALSLPQDVRDIILKPMEG